MKKIKKTSLRKSVEKKVIGIYLALCSLFMPMHVSAGELEQSTLVQGAIKLIGDAISVATIMTAGVVVFFLIKHMYKYICGEDDEKPVASKNAKRTLVVGVLIIAAEVIVNVLFGYFVV